MEQETHHLELPVKLWICGVGTGFQSPISSTALQIGRGKKASPRFSTSSRLRLVEAVRAHLLPEKRGQFRLLGHEIVNLSAIAGQVVQLLLAVLRRRDELEELAPVAIHHGESIGEEVRLVIREARRRRREQRLPLPRSGN